jgi:hypothetical protein
MLLLGTVMKFHAIVSKRQSYTRSRAPNPFMGQYLRSEWKMPNVDHATFKQVSKLMDGARERGRYGHRDATMILVGYRHGCVSPSCVR